MKDLITTLRWVFGVIFTLTGIPFLFFAPIGGILLLILGIFLLPFTLNLIEKKQTIPRAVKYSLPIILFTASIFAFSEEMEVISKEAEFTKLLEKSNSVEFAEKIIAEAKDSTFEGYKRGNYDTLFFEDPELNKSFVALLESNLHKRDSLLVEIKIKKERDSLNRLVIEAEKMKLKRKMLIEKQFSSWDGSHRGLSAFIKTNMKNPDSYEHIETTYKDMGDYLIVQIKYRGTNSFGGIVPGSTLAKISLEGTLLEILQ